MLNWTMVGYNIDLKKNRKITHNNIYIIDGEKMDNIK